MKTIKQVQQKLKIYTDISKQQSEDLKQLQTLVANNTLTREDIDTCYDLLLLEDNTNNAWMHEFKDQLPQYEDELDYAFDSLLQCGLKNTTVDIEQISDSVVETEDTEKYYNLKLEKMTDFTLDFIKDLQLACIKLGTTNIVLDW